MEHKEYNGWTNYETWLVALWMDNEEGSQTYWREHAEQLVKFCKGDKDKATKLMATGLREWHEEANPCPKSGVFADMMNASFGEVDWDEIASQCISVVDDEEVAA